MSDCSSPTLVAQDLIESDSESVGSMSDLCMLLFGEKRLRKM